MTVTDQKTAQRTTGPVGYSLPLSPTGASSMLSPPPWHFSGDVLLVEYRVDPATAARFLPPGLDPGPDPGAAAAVFTHWQWCSDSGEELAAPDRGQFGEFLILLGCAHDGVPMARCPYAWVDSAVPMLRGWLQGMPKQFGAVHQSRVRELGRAGSPLRAGSRFAGVLSVHGERTATASVTLDGTSPEPPVLHTVPLAHTTAFPTWVPDHPHPTVLVRTEVSNVEFSPVWSGPATFTLPAGGDPDLAMLAPVEVGRGYLFGYAETLHGGQALAEPT